MNKFYRFYPKNKASRMFVIQWTFSLTNMSRTKFDKGYPGTCSLLNTLFMNNDGRRP